MGDVTLVLVDVPPPQSAEDLAAQPDAPLGYIQAIAELRRQFGFGLKEAVSIVQGELPKELWVGPLEAQSVKALALRQWGCEVSLIPVSS